MKKQEIGFLMTQWNIDWGAFDDAIMGKLETIDSDDEIGHPDDLIGKLGPRPLILFEQFNGPKILIDKF